MLKLVAAALLAAAVAVVALPTLSSGGDGGGDGGAPGTASTAPGATQSEPGRTGGTQPADRTAEAQPEARATAQRPRLTLRQAVGQRMIFAYDGLEPPAALRARIARGEAAGVILFARNVRSAAQVGRAMRSLQAIRRPEGLRAPLLITVDQEGGPVRRIPGAPQRSAAAAGATGRAASARADGRAAARTLRAAGVNLDLAPVADVGRPGGALSRERRTYGASAGTVARFASAFARGLRAGGVGATAKHFPGFGAAGVNTDDAAAEITLPLSTLRRVDGAPFRRLIDEGVEAVMLSTAVYPALDRRPAAFSRRWVRGELRERLGFDGVTITDDLQTPAVAPYGSPAQLAFFSVRAGVDAPLFAQGYAPGARAAEGLVRAARAGRVSRSELEAGARRMLALRSRLPRD